MAGDELEHNEDDPVTEKLCTARMMGLVDKINSTQELFEEKISGLKHAIYLSTAVMTTVIVIVQFLLSFAK